MPNLPQDTSTKTSLPFGGKLAGWLFLTMLVIAAVIAAVELFRSCALAMSIPPITCTSFGKGISIPEPLVILYAIAGGMVLLWFAASFVWCWARTLPFGGKWVLLFLLGVAGLESLLVYLWQGYADTSFGKITDKIFWVLILWLAAAWRGRAIKEWLEETIKKAVQAPVNVVKETVDGAMQTVKNTAEEGIGKITKGINDAAGAVKETADKSVDKITEGLDKTTEAVKGTADTIADSAKSVGQKISSAGGKVIDKTKDAAVSTGEMIAKVPGQVASVAKDGVTAVAGVFGSDNEQSGTGKDAPSDKNEEDKGKDTNDADTKKSRRWFGKNGKK